MGEGLLVDEGYRGGGDWESHGKATIGINRLLRASLLYAREALQYVQPARQRRINERPPGALFVAREREREKKKGANNFYAEQPNKNPKIACKLEK